MNGIPLPEQTGPLEEDNMLLYAGRGTPEKRVHLVAAIAKAAGVTAGFIGNVEYAVPEELRAYCRFYGEITDAAKMDELYRRHRVIVITSILEGFPMVIMGAWRAGWRCSPPMREISLSMCTTARTVISWRIWIRRNISLRRAHGW